MGHADIATTMRYLHYVERPDEARWSPRRSRSSRESLPRRDAVRDDPRVEVDAHEQRPAADLDVRQPPRARSS